MLCTFVNILSSSFLDAVYYISNFSIPKFGNVNRTTACIFYVLPNVFQVNIPFQIVANWRFVSTCALPLYTDINKIKALIHNLQIASWLAVSHAPAVVVSMSWRRLITANDICSCKIQYTPYHLCPSYSSSLSCVHILTSSFCFLLNLDILHTLLLSSSETNNSQNDYHDSNIGHVCSLKLEWHLSMYILHSFMLYFPAIIKKNKEYYRIIF